MDPGRFVGRSWLLPRLLRWLDEAEDRMFVLTGEPGSGKSRVLAWMSGVGSTDDETEARSLLTRFRSHVKAAHFCIANSGAVAPRRVAENLAGQLARNVDGFAAALAESLKDLITIDAKVFANTIAPGGRATGVHITHLDLGSLSERRSFDRALRTPLQTLYRQGHPDKIVVLVDAIDESLTYSEEACIARLLPELDDLPSQVRFLVSTRPDDRVLKYYRQFTPFNIIKDAPAQADDVGQYVHDRLTVLGDEARRSELARQVSKAADGNFLYARLVLNDLIPRLPDISDLDLATLSLPTGLSGLYRDFLNREVDTRETIWDDHLKPFLGLVSVAQGEGLTRSQIERISGREMGRAQRACAQYLEGPSPTGPFRPFHRSFADFLLNDVENTDYHINATDMHGRIADYYLADPRHWSEEDGYAPRALGIHLIATGRAEALDALIDNPEWYDVHLKADPTGAAFLDDLTRAWGEAEREDAEAIERGESPPLLGREVYYVAAVASIRRRSGGYPPALITALLANGRWTGAQTLAVARQVPDPRMRAEALLALMKELPDPLAAEARAGCELAAQQIPQPYFRAEVKARLALRLADGVREAALRHAFEEAKGAQLTWERSESLAMLAPHLPETLLRETLAVVREAGADEPMQLQVLVALAPHLPEPLLREAHEIALGLETSDSREIALLAIATRDPESAGLEASAALLDRTRAIRDDVERSKVLATLIPVLPLSLLPAAREVVLSINPWYQRARPLMSLAERHVRENEPSEAFAALRLIDVWWQRAEALGRVAPLLAPETTVEALDLARAIPASTVLWHAQALAVLIPRLPEADRQAVLDEAVRDLSCPDDTDDRTAARADFAGYLDSRDQGELLEQVATIEDETDRSFALEALIPRVREPLRDRALEIIKGIGKPDARYRALKTFVPWLSGTQVGRIFDQFWATDERATELLTALAPRLTEEPVADRGLRLAGQIQSARDRARALAALAPHLPDGRRRAMIELVWAIDDPEARRNALAATAAYAPDSERRAVLDEFAGLLRAREGSRGGDLHVDDWSLASLAGGFVALGYANEALATLADVSDAALKSELLLAVLPQLTDAQLDSARMIAQGIHDWKFAAQASAAVGSRLSENLLTPVLDAVLREGDAILLVEAVAGAAPHRPDHERQALFSRAIVAAGTIRDLRPRVQAITLYLTPYLDEIPSKPLYTYWCETLHMLAERPRKELLPYLGSLASVSARLGGSVQAKKAAHAITEVGQRWP